MKKIMLFVILGILLASCGVQPSQNVPPPNPMDSWLSFVDQQNGMQINYPPTFTLGKVTYPILVSIKYPQSYYAGTTLQDSGITVQLGKNVAECSVSAFNNKPIVKTMTQNGATFNVDEWTEGATGHTGDSIGYYTVKNNTCYKVVLSMYAVNRDMYSDGNGGYLPNAPVLFDRLAVVSIFNQIFSTLKLL